ncbi:glycosyltransferase family 39 protein [Candidatus Woesebacteria bacterium]|nr:glycosyltransferase family 39 protein [Candidatus Woesebacteria bacterium]
MKNKLLLILILGIAALLRLFSLGLVPIELNRDEASIGYTAYSLLKTGSDEYGRKWPLNLESFGDWKLPVYEWATIPSVALFDLSAWSARLPSAIAGIVGVYLLYQLTLILVVQSKYRYSFALLTALFLAISPWHIHFSRMAYEANLGLTLFLAGLLLFLTYINKKRVSALLFSGLCLGLTMVCYHAFQIVTPLFVVILIFIFRKQIQLPPPKQLFNWLLFLSLVIAPIVLLFASGLTHSNQVKLSGLSIFEEQTYYLRLFNKREYFNENQAILAKLYTNIPMEFFRQLFLNSTLALNPDFLFINGAGHGSHDISGIGKFYSAMLPLLIIGIATLFSRHSLFTSNGRSLIITWLVVGLLPAIITWQPAHATRSYAVVIPLMFLATQGSFWLYQIIQKRPKSIQFSILCIFLIILVYQVGSMLVTYFIVSPQRDIDNWTWYAKDMTNFLSDARSRVDHVYVQGNSWSPYIFYLFYARINPRTAQEQLVHLPPDLEGFRHVSNFDTIEFGDVPFQHLLEAGESYAIFAPLSQLPADFSEDPQQFDLYQVFSNTHSKESYVAIIKN